MKVYVIVRHYGTSEEEVLSDYIDAKRWLAIQRFVCLKTSKNEPIGLSWTRLEAQGYSCEPAELTLTREKTT